MKRVLALYFPYWSVDLYRRRIRNTASPAESPILLTAPNAGRELVGACCRLARAKGVHIGMDLTNARALLPAAALVAPHHPSRDADSLHALACWCLRFSPTVAPLAPDSIAIDVSGMHRLYPRETAIIRRIRAAMRRLGLCARPALSSTLGCSLALARFGSVPAIVPPGAEREAISPLPLAALRIDPSAIDILEELGVTTVGQLLRLPRSALPARFGPDILVRIDQALGVRDELLEPVRPPAPLRAAITFEGPTTRTDAVEAAARQLLTQLVSQLHHRGVGARRLDITLARANAHALTRSIALSRPNRDPTHLWSLLRPHLERADMADGVEAISIHAPRLARISHRQLTTQGRDVHEQPLSDLTDTLVNRLGPSAVLRPREISAHIPERAFSLDPATDAPPPASPHLPPSAPDPASLRPTLLYEHPCPARVCALSPDGPVLSLHWKGRDYHVASCFGPERIAPPWWIDPTAGVRDYFRIRIDSGRWLWIYHEWPHARWFVHGEWA